MPHITVTANAQANLHKLHQFIAAERPDSAIKAMKTIVAAIDRLKQFPELGVEHELVQGMRLLTVPFGKSGYVVYYRYVRPLDRVFILKVKHGRELG
jgi:plasmid stabilization system protein ParE